MSTLEMKSYDQRDYSGLDMEDEFEQIPFSLDPNGKDMNYISGHQANSERDARLRLAKEVKDKRIAFPKSQEARSGRRRGEIVVTE